MENESFLNSCGSPVISPQWAAHTVGAIPTRQHLFFAPRWALVMVTPGILYQRRIPLSNFCIDLLERVYLLRVRTVCLLLIMGDREASVPIFSPAITPLPLHPRGELGAADGLKT